MNNPGWIVQLFETIDQYDVDKFLTFVTDDAVFRFGNSDPVKGKEAINDLLAAFFKNIRKLTHEVQETWEYADTVICHGIVTYTRHDSSEYTVPFANIFKMDAHLIREYRIYIDNSKLYATT